VKDSSGDFAQFRAYRAVAPDLAITVGSEPDIGRALAEGGVGTICGMGNVAPELVQAMFRPNPPVEQMQAACGLVSGPFIALLKAMLAAGHADRRRAATGTTRRVDAAIRWLIGPPRHCDARCGEEPPD
jgi:4-hydroxy-tetrahydrodipicolinate synthase